MKFVESRLCLGLANASLGLIAAFTSLSSMAASEVYPGAFTAFAPGTQRVGAYYYQREFEGYYRNGRQTHDGKITAQATVLAYTNYGQTGDLPSSWSVHLPYIDAHRVSGRMPRGFGETTSTLSDLRVAYTFWPINNVEQGQSLAVSSTLQIPTATYNHRQSLNAGENRWKATFQFGWIQKLSPNVSLDLVPEAAFYSTNSNYVGYVMTQKPTYALTSYLRWRFVPHWESQIGFQTNTGGQQTIAGFQQNNQARQQRLFLGLTTRLVDNIYAGLRYSHDNAVRSDVKTTSDIVLSLNCFF